MKNRLMKKILIVLILCLSMVTSTSAFSVLEIQYRVYDPEKSLLVSVGDSILAGCGISEDSYNVNGWDLVTWSAPYLVAKELDMNLAPLAHAGARTRDLSYLFNDESSVTEEDFMESIMCGTYFDRGVEPEEIREFFLDYVEQADVILLDIGSSDVTNDMFRGVLSFLASRVEEYTGVEINTGFGLVDDDEMEVPFRPDYLGFGTFEIHDVQRYRDMYAKLMEEYNLTHSGEEETVDYTEVLLSILLKADALGLLRETTEVMMEKCETGMSNFKLYFREVLEGLQGRMKEGSTLVVANHFNPYAELILSDEYPIPLGRILEKIINEQNTYIEGLEEEFGFLFADVRGVELYTDTSVSRISQYVDEYGIVAAMVEAAHPTEKGHRQMADIIEEVLASGSDVLYSDVAAYSPYYEAIRFATRNRYMTGVTDSLFLPYLTVDKLTLAKALYALAGSPSVEENPCPSGM